MRFSILEYLWIYKCLWTRHDDMLKNKDLVLGELYRLCDDNRQRIRVIHVPPPLRHLSRPPLHPPLTNLTL